MDAGGLWGVSAIALGAWEATAYGTRRVPTVSRTVWWALDCRYRPAAQLVVAVYVAGLARHLLRPPPR